MSSRYQKVVLYYPNNWKRYIGDLATAEEKKFNWFLCSKRYKDPKTGIFVAEISRGTKFYEESTGKTLVAPLRSDDASEADKILLWIVKTNEQLPTHEQIQTFGYQGLARLQKCELSNKASDEFVICKEAEFDFLFGVLEESKALRACPIIDFSKRNNRCIRTKLPEFPTCAEIDDVLEKHNCSAVCRVLYEYIYEYLSKL